MFPESLGSNDYERVRIAFGRSSFGVRLLQFLVGLGHQNDLSRIKLTSIRNPILAHRDEDVPFIRLAQRPAMQPFASAPRCLVKLLGMLVMLVGGQAIMFSARPWHGLLWASVIAALSLSTLFGDRRAASALKYILYYLSVVVFLGIRLAPLAGPWATAGLALQFIQATLTLLVAVYLSRSKDIASFLATIQSRPPS